MPVDGSIHVARDGYPSKAEMVKHLCATKSVPVDAVPPEAAALYPENDETTPLVLALKDQDEDLVVYLLSLRQDINLDRKIDGSTVPAYAAVKGMLRVLQALVLDHGVDCTREENNPAYSPLIAATMFGRLSTVDFILQQFQARGRLEDALQRSGMGAEEGEPLMFIAAYIDREIKGGGGTDSVAMARLLVEKWGFRVPRFSDDVDSGFYVAMVNATHR